LIAVAIGVLVAVNVVLRPRQTAEVEGGAERSVAGNFSDPASGVGAPRGEAEKAGQRESGDSVAASDLLREWVARFRLMPEGSPKRREAIDAGLRLAKARASNMERLIRNDPRRAIEEALQFDEWRGLSPVIQAEVERPFSVAAPCSQYPICHQPEASGEVRESASVSVFSMPDSCCSLRRRTFVPMG
jgi:hypothetical protein